MQSIRTLLSLYCSGRGTWTPDFKVMSLARCHCVIPHCFVETLGFKPRLSSALEDMLTLHHVSILRFALFRSWSRALLLVAEAGFEPAVSRLWALRDWPLPYSALFAEHSDMNRNLPYRICCIYNMSNWTECDIRSSNFRKRITLLPSLSDMLYLQYRSTRNRTRAYNPKALLGQGGGGRTRTCNHGCDRP